jgi:hypothetical protein
MLFSQYPVNVIICKTFSSVVTTSLTNRKRNIRLWKMLCGVTKYSLVGIYVEEGTVRSNWHENLKSHFRWVILIVSFVVLLHRQY